MRDFPGAAERVKAKVVSRAYEYQRIYREAAREYSSAPKPVAAFGDNYSVARSSKDSDAKHRSPTSFADTELEEKEFGLPGSSERIVEKVVRERERLPLICLKAAAA